MKGLSVLLTAAMVLGAAGPVGVVHAEETGAQGTAAAVNDTVSGSDAGGSQAVITLGDAEFTGDLWSDGIWELVPSTWDNATFKYTTYLEKDEWIQLGDNQGSSGFDFWMGDAGSYTLLQKVDISAGTYTVSADFMGEGADVQLVFAGQSGTAQSMEGYNVWMETSNVFTVTEDLTDAAVGFQVTVDAGGWGYLDSISVVSGGTAAGGGEEEPVEPVDASIYVPRVANITDDFIGGADISSYVSLKNSGVKFYDFDGNELDDQGFFDLLAASGMNYVRIRVWNDPYDENGNGYGGGNNDLETAVKIGQWATNAGMKVLIDFHYSDFWADPAKQRAPKAWENYSIDEKVNAVNTFTAESLDTLFAAGVDVGMVQVGNETDNGVCGESSWVNKCRIFNAGSSAVRAAAEKYQKEILVAVHFANPSTGDYAGFAENLADNQVDYDVFATSYYPYWHGTLSNLKSVLGSIAKTYEKKVMVAETSWSYTYVEGDGHTNTIYEGQDDVEMDYDVSIQGQANELYNVINTVAGIDGGIGVFYWEPAWLPVQVYDADAENAADVLAQNKAIWETLGSGWASSYSGNYDEDAGEWYGGSAVDNQALFDFYGHPLDTLNIFKYVKTGTNAPIVFSRVEDAAVTKELGQAVTLPEKVSAVYSDGSKVDTDVTWNEEQLAAAIAAGTGSYQIDGTVMIDGVTYSVKCSLTIKPANLLLNPGFEDPDSGVWVITDEGGSADIKDDSSNVKSGFYCLHFWNDKAIRYTVEQTITLDAGYYSFGGYLQGGDAGENDVFKLYVKNGDEILEAESSVSSWHNWTQPCVENFLIAQNGTEITVGIYVEATAGAWGSWDEMYLYRTGDVPAEEPDDNTDDNINKDDDSNTNTDNNISDDGGNTGSSASAALDWNQVKEEVKGKVAEILSNSKLESINMNYVSGSETKVPGAVLAQIKGTKVTVAFHNGNGAAMSISGENLKGIDLSGINELDLTVVCDTNSIPENAAASKSASALSSRQISVKNSGMMIVPVNMHVRVDKDYEGKYANLYRYNTQSGQLEYCGSYRVAAGGHAMFGILQGGEYLLTITEQKPNDKIVYSGNQYVVKTGDNLSVIAKRLNLSLSSLIQKNPQLKDVNLIMPGQKLNLN